MDPFEARLMFIKSLKKLNGSIQANDTAIQFMLKNIDLEEDLYSCILQELDGSSINSKLNILYFIESLCIATSASQQKTASSNEDPLGNKYHIWILRDLPTIFDKVVPENQAGLVNVQPTRIILRNFEEREYLNEDEIKALDEWLDSRESDCQVSKDPGNSDKKGNGSYTLSKEDILRRMDDDRERSKRFKENIWAIDYAKDGVFAEFDMLWDSTTIGLTSIDFERMNESNEIARAALQEDKSMYA